jgi:WD40 repeat protein
MIFISYSRVDTAIAHDIEGHLTRSNFKVFIDYQGIAGGAEFMAVIGNAIQQSQAIVLLLSREATSSRWVLWELGWAFQLGTPIVPLLIEPVSFDRIFPLASINILDFREFANTRQHCLSLLDEALNKVSHSAPTEPHEFVPFTSASSQTEHDHMSDSQLFDVFLSALRARDTEPEIALYQARTVLEQDPDYVGGWLKELVSELDSRLRDGRILALEQRLAEAVGRSDAAVAEVVAKDIVKLDRSHADACEVLARGARRRKCNALYQAAESALATNVDSALSLLLEIRRLEPEYGDPQRLLANEPITARSAGLVRPLRTLEIENAHARNHFAYSPVRELIGVTPYLTDGSWNENKVALFRAGDPDSLHLLASQPDSYGYTRWISHLAFSADGAWLATGTDRGPIEIWDTQRCERVTAIEHGGELFALALASDARIAAAVIGRHKPFGSGTPCRLALWTLPSGDPLFTIPGQEASAQEVAFFWSTDYGSVSLSQDGSLVASVWLDRIRVLDCASKAVVVNFKYRGARLVALDPANRWIAASTGYEVRLFDLVACRSFGPEELPPSVPLNRKDRKGPVQCVTFAPGLDLLAIGSETKTVELWDLNRSRCVETLFNDRLIDLDSLVFSPDARQLYIKNYVYGLA